MKMDREAKEKRTGKTWERKREDEGNGEKNRGEKEKQGKRGKENE